MCKTGIHLRKQRKNDTPLATGSIFHTPKMTQRRGEGDEEEEEGEDEEEEEDDEEEDEYEEEEYDK